MPTTVGTANAQPCPHSCGSYKWLASSCPIPTGHRPTGHHPRRRAGAASDHVDPAQSEEGTVACSRAVARQHRVVPLRQEGDTLVIGAARPQDGRITVCPDRRTVQYPGEIGLWVRYPPACRRRPE
ncbi:MAG: hypothetical protein ACQETP_05495 [Bacteroidota bacterium]